MIPLFCNDKLTSEEDQVWLNLSSSILFFSLLFSFLLKLMCHYFEQTQQKHEYIPQKGLFYKTLFPAACLFSVTQSLHLHSLACLDVKCSVRNELHLHRFCCYTQEPHNDIMRKIPNELPKYPYHPVRTHGTFLRHRNQTSVVMHVTQPEHSLGLKGS